MDEGSSGLTGTRGVIAIDPRAGSIAEHATPARTLLPPGSLAPFPPLAIVAPDVEIRDEVSRLRDPRNPGRARASSPPPPPKVGNTWRGVTREARDAEKKESKGTIAIWKDVLQPRRGREREGGDSRKVGVGVESRRNSREFPRARDPRGSTGIRLGEGARRSTTRRPFDEDSGQVSRWPLVVRSFFCPSVPSVHPVLSPGRRDSRSRWPTGKFLVKSRAKERESR